MNKKQIEKFRETARELETDESEEKWLSDLRKIAGAPTKSEEDKATGKKAD
jgi:hypothetical protein